MFEQAIPAVSVIYLRATVCHRKATDGSEEVSDQMMQVISVHLKHILMEQKDALSPR